MKKKLVSVLLSAAVAVSMLAGCGSNSSDKTESKEDGSPKKVEVACYDGWTNVSYIDENGDLTGYEVELLKAIDDELDDYEFDFQPSSANFLTLIDTGKIDLASSMYTYTEERAKKYLFTTEGYRDMNQYLVCLEGKDYTTLDSLAGKTLGLGFEDDSTATIMKEYNEKNPDKAVNLDYYGDAELDVVAQGVKEGRWDALTESNSTLAQLNEVSDVKFIKGDVVEESQAYWILKKDDEHEKLRDEIDKVLVEFKENGKLNELHEKWFGTDAYTE